SAGAASGTTPPPSSAPSGVTCGGAPQAHAPSPSGPCKRSTYTSFKGTSARPSNISSDTPPKPPTRPLSTDRTDSGSMGLPCPSGWTRRSRSGRSRSPEMFHLIVTKGVTMEQFHDWLDQRAWDAAQIQLDADMAALSLGPTTNLLKQVHALERPKEERGW
ncbi:hypothetical protein FRC08_015969, partial [Ceratobasidium sp. 394]